LAEHNDYIRGEGFFERVLEFLGVLREMGIESGVMLTLTRDNMDQVLELGELLRERADSFTFNRLCPVGEGANLLLPEPADYREFVSRYVEASRENPVLRYKDNLLNLSLEEKGLRPFEGCTGYGCGAAFNFIAILPDGEAHACRKFPSVIGNVLEDGIGAVYDSAEAARYRRGSRSCDGCRLRPVCGSCLAVLHGLGKDLEGDRDPFCFIDGTGGDN